MTLVSFAEGKTTFGVELDIGLSLGEEGWGEEREGWEEEVEIQSNCKGY